jgi:hypothetical protein
VSLTLKQTSSLGLEGIVSKKLDAPYRSGPSKTWIKGKNPKSPGSPPHGGAKAGPPSLCTSFVKNTKPVDRPRIIRNKYE